MFQEREINPETEEDLRKREHFVVAHSLSEVMEKDKDLTGCGLPIYGAIHIDRVLHVWKGFDTSWSALDGIRVLDLASGSARSRDLLGDVWYPQFSRLCAVNGAIVTVLDGNPQTGVDNDLFEWRQVDLISAALTIGLQNLPVLKGRKFDIINSSNFIGINPPPFLWDQLKPFGASRKDLDYKFTEQAGELLAEDGFMSLDTRDKDHFRVVYTKKNGVVTPLDLNF